MTKQTKQRISYPIKSYRLNKKTTQKLQGLKQSSGKSYNLLFLDLIRSFAKQ